MKKKIISLTAVAIVLLMLVFTFPCFAETDLKETTRTGIIGAMDEEVNSLKEALDEKRINTIAGIAQVCSLNGVPFVIIRAISDNADDSEEMSYVEFEQAAAEKCAALTRYMVTH